MIARINFATRERPAVQPAFSNGYRQHGSTIKEALALADLYMPGQPLAPEDVEVIQLIIDSGLAWQRGEAFARKMRDFIDLGQATLPRRSYCPNPKRVSHKGVHK